MLLLERIRAAVGEVRLERLGNRYIDSGKAESQTSVDAIVRIGIGSGRRRVVPYMRLLLLLIVDLSSAGRRGRRRSPTGVGILLVHGRSRGSRQGDGIERTWCFCL